MSEYDRADGFARGYVRALVDLDHLRTYLRCLPLGESPVQALEKWEAVAWTHAARFRDHVTRLEGSSR